MAQIEKCEFCDGVIEYRHTRARFHYKGERIYVERVAEFNRRSFCPRPFSSFVFFPLFRFRFRPISRLPTWSIPPNPA